MLFGNPAVSKFRRPVAFRPHLAMGLAFSISDVPEEQQACQESI